MDLRSKDPHITRYTVWLPNNNVPEIVTFVVNSPTGQQRIFSCLWDDATDSLSGPWIVRENTSPTLNIS